MKQEHELLIETLDLCKSKPGFNYEINFEKSQIHLLLRKSFAPRHVMCDSSRRCFWTIDIVCFGYIPFVFGCGELTVEDIPKGLFKPHLETIIGWCKQHDLSIFIENIQSEKLYEHYLKQGFVHATQSDCLILPFY